MSDFLITGILVTLTMIVRIICVVGLIAAIGLGILIFFQEHAAAKRQVRTARQPTSHLRQQHPNRSRVRS